ncbi:MAG TPA: lysylphosphatidylglycerol synthase transmembrane domain-containing protein [Anaerolineaceae bacterium]|nr:lysylphosphatidylglycerol synthase transmembrane domain-containing protein [Anaerolineaceae bacterium]HPN53650.1 lysylphosphatidylglycerol synthase transmembrane domain-containing protein [Anaerolineaceae bacterium]
MDPEASLSPAPGTEPKPQWRQWLRWAGTLLTLALLIFIAAANWNDILTVFQRISPLTIGLVLVIMVASRLTVCGRWYVLLRSAEMNITPWQCIRLVFAGLFASNFLPTTIGGDAVRLTGAVLLKFDAATIAASLVMDRLVGMFGMATLLPVGIFQVFSGAAGPAALSLAITPAKIWQKLRQFLASLWQVFLRWAKKPLALGQAVLWTYGHMACLFITIWLLLRDMGQDVPLWTIGGLWVLNYFITLLPVSINGLGLQEFAITTLYTQFAGVPTETSLALALIIRVLYLLASLPGAAFVPGILSAQGAAQKNHGTS